MPSWRRDEEADGGNLAAWVVLCLGMIFIGTVAAMLISHFVWDVPVRAGINCRKDAIRCHPASLAELVLAGSLFGLAGIGLTAFGVHLLRSGKNK